MQKLHGSLAAMPGADGLIARGLPPISCREGADADTLIAFVLPVGLAGPLCPAFF